MAQVPYAQALPVDVREQLITLAAQFADRFSISGAGNLVVTDDMRFTVAVHAVIPVLDLGLEWYHGFRDIVLYPGDFRVRDEWADDAGVVHEDQRTLCGQAIEAGPMVLSWGAILEDRGGRTGLDVIIHECAHKLDALNGPPNGFPPLRPTQDPVRWSRDFREAFERLGTLVARGEETTMDPYGAEDPPEFFAVASETFFADPGTLHDFSPLVYAHLRDFYGQDPRL